MTNIKEAKEYIKEVIKVLDTIEIAKEKAEKMRAWRDGIFSGFFRSFRLKV